MRLTRVDFPEPVAPRIATTCPGVGLPVGPDVREADALERHAALDLAAGRLGEAGRPGLVLHVGYLVQYRDHAADRRVGGRHLREQHAQQDERDHHRHEVVEQHEDRAELDLLVDDETAADPQRPGEPEVDHEQERGIEDRGRALRRDRRLPELGVLLVEAGVLVVLAHERLDDPDAGHVLLQHLVEAIEVRQHLAVQGRALELVEGKHGDRHRQEHQHHQRQPDVDPEQDQDRADDHQRRA
jgi:hypothetical protein